MDVPDGWEEIVASPEYIVKLALVAPAVSVTEVQVVPPSLLISAVISVLRVELSTNWA